MAATAPPQHDSGVIGIRHLPRGAGLLRRARRSLLLAALALAPGAPAIAQAPADTTEFLRLEQRWNAAHLSGAADSLAQLWHADLIVAVPGMDLLDREGSLAVVRTRLVRLTRYETSDLTVRTLGPRAVVSGRLIRERVRDGRTHVDDWRFTKVYRREGDRWLVVSFVATENPTTGRPAVPQRTRAIR